MSACLATADAARGLTVGVHGTTFGGNPLAMAVGNATLDVILAPGFLERVARLGLDMRQRLAELKDRHAGVIEEVRGEGLMIGLKLKVPPADFRRRPRSGRSCSSFPPATMSCASCRRSSSPTRRSPKACGGSTPPARRSRSAWRWRSTERAMNAPFTPSRGISSICSSFRAGELRGILDMSAERSRRRASRAPRRRRVRSPARRWR